MTEAELLAQIGSYERAALGSSVAAGPSIGGNVTPASQQMTTLEVDRYNALNAYFARPMGNEQADRSQVVLPELRDTIEWIMPTLMRMFAATPKVCEFMPVNPGDEEPADIETQVVNYVFMRQNEGFFILHDMFKDALLLRNGYVKAYWDTKKKTAVENYTGLTENEVQKLMQTEDEIEILGQEEKVAIVLGPMGPQQTSTFDIKLRRTSEEGYVKVECVPPEEILVSPKARHSLDDCPFVEHKTNVTRTWLKQAGFDVSKVESIERGNPDWLNLIALARDEVTDQLSEEDPNDKASQDVTLREVYIRIDFDGDGEAELRRVMVGGDQILSNEECEEIPVAYASPVRMPHRHVGISFYDLLNDLQVIKTTLFRQALDNLYLSNNQRTAVNWQNVNLEDLLTNRPGGVVRVNGAPGENIMPLTNDPSMMQQVIPALEYVDHLREMRTGIGRDTMGVDADSLQDVTKGGQLAAMSAAAMKVELVARMLAEGVKDIFRKIHSELRRHQDKPMTVQLTGKWIDVNPADWREREMVNINVGLGSGNREESRANISLLGQMQNALQPYGLVGPKQAYETFKHGVNILGFENPERYAMDPESQEYQQWMQQHKPSPPPQLQVAQIKAQTDMQREQLRAQTVQMQTQSQQAQENARLQSQLIQAQAGERSAQLKAQAEIMHAASQGGADREIEMAKMQSAETQTLIKVLGQILAQQLKQDAQADAGQMLRHDLGEMQ